MDKTQTEKSPSPGAAVVERLLLAYGAAEITALAERMGESPSTVKNWRYRSGAPLEQLMKASRDTKRSLDWLAFGDGAPSLVAASSNFDLAIPGPDGATVLVQVKEPSSAWRLHADAPVSPNSPPDTRGATSRGADALLPAKDLSDARPLVMSLQIQGAGKRVDYEVIPKVMGGAAAGSSADPASSGPLTLDRVGDVALSYEWLHRNLQHTSGSLASVQVVGDSMAPTLLDGDTIIIDTGVREVRVDDVYVIQMRGRRLVKRVQRKFDGSMVIISDNPAYEREILPRDQAREVEVVGRKVMLRIR